MRLLQTDVTPQRHGVRLTGSMERANGDPFDAHVDYHGLDASHVASGADAMAAAMLIPSMRDGEDLEICPPISPLLAYSLPRARDIFHTWYPAFSRIEIRCSPQDMLPIERPARAATFFSGGVDSFYTLLKHTHGAGTLPVPLTHVIYLRGVEQRLEHTKGAEEAQAWVQSIAQSAGVGCITGVTNLRTTLQGPVGRVHWERHYHGSALAGIGLGLSGLLSYVCIPSAFSYNHMVAHGSTPLLDEMFSSDQVRVVHDGAEMTRARKVARILEWDRELVLSHLRVCIMNEGGAYNCGRCYKCVRTAIPLRVLGALDDARTFTDKSDAHWEGVLNGDHLVLIEENLDFAREAGADRNLISVLERVVRRRRRAQGAKEYVRNSSLARLLPAARAVRSWLAQRAGS
ncbi:MAG TPA: hypothetical protein VGI14_17215 [Casimicrobiaceae bacterium]|jgi:hypothetical protein